MSAWATYQNALRLILTGDTTRPLNADQRTLFLHMVARGRRDENGNERESRELPGVQTQDRDGERFFFIPDLVHFMLNEFRDEWDIQGPPLDLDYLNSLKVGDESPFLFGAAPSAKAWNENAMGQRHWELVCKEIEILGELAVLQRLHHADDPMKWREIRNSTKEFKDELDAVRSEMREIDDGLVKIKPGGRVDSCLPRFPSDRPGEIAEVIMEAAKILFESDQVCPSANKVWRKLQKADIPGYDMDTKGYGEGEVVLIGSKELNYENFRKRWSRYRGQ